MLEVVNSEDNDDIYKDELEVEESDTDNDQNIQKWAFYEFFSSSCLFEVIS